MTKTYQWALLTALGMAGFVGNSQAQTYNAGDLLVGIYDPSAANTLVVDLGSASSIVSQNFQQWNLSADLTAAGITLSGASQYGVVGATTGASGSIFSTGLGSSSYSPANANNASSDVSTIAGNGATGYNIQPLSGVSAVGNDWYNQTIVVPAASGTFIADIGNPNTTAGTEEILYQSITSEVNNRTHVTTPGSEVSDLPFLLDPTSGTLTYGAPVPEPSTYALVAGAGLLALTFRNKLVRKQA